MKKWLFISAFLLISKFGFSQEISISSPTIDAAPTRSVEIQDENQIYNSSGIETKPEFPGGNAMFYKYVSKNFRMPKAKDFKGGKVIVSFVIEKDGSVTDIKVIRHPGFETDKETVRLLKSCPKWQPGVQNGRNVRALYTLPITLSSN